MASLRVLPLALAAACLLLGSCASGKKWVNAPLRAKGGHHGIRLLAGPPPESTANEEERLASPHGSVNPPPRPLTEADLADAKSERPSLKLQGEKRLLKPGPVDGRLLGVFRNTYYDFPAEADFTGPKTPLMNAACQPIDQVPRSFYEAVCVQGSGTLLSGATVSFAKRDCGCAQICPRTGQKICFDTLDQRKFPWGRGARGTAITPLRSIAVDSSVIPLGTKVYILEYDGVARSPGGARHDGCFVAEDRGLKVVGDHVDIFTGNPRITQHLNQAVPSNEGVHVYLDTARCESLEL